MQPVTLEQATPAIEQFLRNERKQKAALRRHAGTARAAKIEYVGDFAADAARSPYQPGVRARAAAAHDHAGDAAGLGVQAAPQVDRGRVVAPTIDRRASMPSGSTLDKGLKGLEVSPPTGWLVRDGAAVAANCG